MAKPVPVATLANEFLRRCGREERLVRARGYWRLHKGESHCFRESGLYCLGAGPLPALEHVLGAIRAVYEAEEVPLQEKLLPGVRVVDGRRVRVCPDGHKNLYYALRCSTCGKVCP